MKEGWKITFHGKEDQEPGLVHTEDIIIALDQNTHTYLRRRIPSLCAT